MQNRLLDERCGEGKYEICEEQRRPGLMPIKEWGVRSLGAQWRPVRLNDGGREITLLRSTVETRLEYQIGR